MFLTEILAKLQGAYDLVVAAGPATLRTGAEAVKHLEDAMRLAADYLEKLPGGTQAAPGGPEHQHALRRLSDLKRQAEEAAREPSWTPEGAQAWNPGELLGKLSPELRAAILKLIASLTGGLTAVPTA